MQNKYFGVANHKNEQSIFKDILSLGSQVRALLLQGESGVGKTTLIETFFFLAKKEFVNYQVVHFQFSKNETTDMFNIFYQFGEDIGWEKMTFLLSAITKYQKLFDSPSIDLKSNVLFGLSNKVTINQSENNNEMRKLAILEITRCFFEDINNLESPLLIFIDAYEFAASEIQDWITQQFLKYFIKKNNLRIVISGQTVPSVKSPEWKILSHYSELKPVSNPKDWESVFNELGKKSKCEQIDTLQFLEILCLCGNPIYIMQGILNSPDKNEMI